MDNDTLVKESHKIISILKKEGHVSLFMLKSLEYDVNDLSLIISSSAYDNLSKKQALMQLLDMLDHHLNEKMLKKIMRITILKTTDSFVKAINQLFQVTHFSVTYLNSAIISDIHIENALILESCQLKPA